MKPRPGKASQREKADAGPYQREDTMRAPAFLNFAAALAAAGLLPVCGANAQDTYNVGVTAAMTGPASATQAPVIEMLRIYVDRINAKGGINGHKINLLDRRRSGRAVEGRGQRHQAGPAGKRRAC